MLKLKCERYGEIMYDLVVLIIFLPWLGWRITGHSRTPRKRMQCKAGQQVAGVLVENCDLMVVGLAVCWGNQDAYYLNLRTSQDGELSMLLGAIIIHD